MNRYECFLQQKRTLLVESRQYEHDGNAVTLGESGALSHKRPPSNEQPSSCNPVILIEVCFSHV